LNLFAVAQIELLGPSGERLGVWSKSIVSRGIKSIHSIQCKLYTQEQTHTDTHTQIQMQILEVTQPRDRVRRDLGKNGEVRVIK